VFVDRLRTEWDPRVIRLGILVNHYRHSWEWHDRLMPEAAERLERWLGAAGPASARVMEEVRQRLDDDLDTPGAMAAVDDAVARGEGVREAAALLGVALDRPPGLDLPRTVPGPGRWSE
jgi:L-cysteine:1D-myo-inositol 2-amino-2-deoxy-alpha-D-glucopyranoside ligase